jgi:hypothetical protein
MNATSASLFTLIETITTWLLMVGFAVLFYWFVWYLIKTWLLIPLIKKNLADEETKEDKTN